MRIGVALLAVAAVAGAGTLRAEEASFKVVVPAAMKGTVIKRTVVADVFLRKVTRWGDGTQINPVDQSATSPVRISFSERVLGKPVAGVQIYFMRQIASPGGASPPPVKTSDEEVIAYVAAKPGAIGYVSVTAPLPEGVKEIQLGE